MSSITGFRPLQLFAASISVTCAIVVTISSLISAAPSLLSTHVPNSTQSSLANANIDSPFSKEPISSPSIEPI